MADFDPKAYLASSKSDFDPKLYLQPSKKEAVKYEPEEDTVYSPEGVPLITPRTVEPAGKKSEAAREILTDIAAAPVRAAASIVKPVATAAELLGTTALSKPLMQMDEGIKIATSPEEEGFLGSRGPISTIASLGGDILGGGALVKGAQKALQGAKLIPGVTEKVAEYGPKIEQAWDKMNLIPKSAIAGSAGAVTQPVGIAAGEEGYGEEKAKQAFTGALAGPVFGLGAKAVGAMASPALQRLKDLEAQGIDIQKFIKGDSTLGQILGGGVQKLENFLSVFPFSGLKEPMKKGTAELGELGQKSKDAIQQSYKEGAKDINKAVNEQIKQQRSALNASNKATQRNLNDEIATQRAELAIQHDNQRVANSDRAKAENLAHQNATAAENLSHQNATAAENQALADEVSGYSIPVINRALEPLGQKLPENIKGTQAVDFTQKAISQAYEDELNRIGKIPFTKVEKDQLGAFLDPKNLKNYSLKPDEKALLMQDIANLQQAAGKNRTLSGRQWQEELQRLGDKSYELRQSGSFSEREYGKALRDVKDNWMQLLENNSGSENIKNINKAHSLFQGPQRASTHLKTFLEGGDFKPEQLVAAMRTELPSKRFASGTDPLVEDAVKRYQEIAKKKADLKIAQDQRKVDMKAAQDQRKADILAAQEERVANTRAAQRAEKSDLADLHNRRQEDISDIKQARIDKASDKKDMLREAQAEKIGNLSEAATAAKEDVSNLIKNVNIEGTPTPVLNKLGYAATISPLLKAASMGAGTVGIPGAHIASSMLNPVLAASLGIGPVTRLAYKFPMQAYKNLATAPRSEGMKAFGEALKKQAPLGGALGAMATEGARIKHPLDYLEDTYDKGKDVYKEYTGD